MKKEFLANIFLILGLNLLIKPFYVFGIEAEVQNVVGPNVYGLFFDLFNLCFIYQFFLDLGVQNYTSRYISEDRQRYQDYFSKTLGSKLILALGFALMVLASFYLLGYERVNFDLLCLVALEMVLISFVMYLRATIAAQGYFRVDSYLSALDKLLLLIVLTYVLYFSSYRADFTILSFVQFQILSTTVVFFIALAFLIRKNGMPSFSISFDYSRKLFKKTAPFALVFLIMTLYTKMDGIMLGRLIDDDHLQAGIYAASFRIIDALNMVGFLFGTLLLPMFAHLELPAERNELWEIAYRLLLNVIIIGLSIGLFYQTEIFQWLYTDWTPYYNEVFIGLLLSFCVMTLAYLFGIMITAKGSLRRLNIVYLVGVAINWIFNLWLIPRYLAVGAAYVTFATQLVILIGLIYLSAKDLGFRIQPVMVIKSIIYLLMSFVVFYIVKVYLMTNWVMAMSFSVLLSILVSFLLGFLRLDLINQLKKPE